MNLLGEKKGLIIFISLISLMIFLSLVAYSATGNMGIEERFTHALGLDGEMNENDGQGWFGLALEGSSLLYAFILGILVIACYAVYRNFRV